MVMTVGGDPKVWPGAGCPRAWPALNRTERTAWLLGLEFKTFVQAFVRLPCQIVRTGRRVVYRLLSWNRYLPIFFRLVDALRC
jgi:hypothetical protein